MLHFPNSIFGRHCLLGGGGGALLITWARPLASTSRSTFSLSRPPAPDTDNLCCLGDGILIWGRGAQYRDCERDTGLELILSLSIDLRSSVGFFAIMGFMFANNSCFEAAFFSSKTPELIKRRRRIISN